MLDLIASVDSTSVILGSSSRYDFFSRSPLVGYVCSCF